MTTRHVTEGELVDLALGGGSRADREHAGSCPACASRLAELCEGVELARKAEVPEPSPLYWEALRRNVSRRIAEEPRSLAVWGRLLPLLAAGLVVVAIAISAGRVLHPTSEAPRAVPSWSALPPEDDDPGLVVLEGVALSDGDLTVWEEGRGLGAFLADLSDADERVLADTLREKAQEGEL
jgi:hypothetical protein